MYSFCLVWPWAGVPSHSGGSGAGRGGGPENSGSLPHPHRRSARMCWVMACNACPTQRKSHRHNTHPTYRSQMSPTHRPRMSQTCIAHITDTSHTDFTHVPHTSQIYSIHICSTYTAHTHPFTHHIHVPHRPPSHPPIYVSHTHTSDSHRPLSQCLFHTRRILVIFLKL